MITHKQQTGYRRTECGRPMSRDMRVGDWSDMDCKQCLKQRPGKAGPELVKEKAMRYTITNLYTHETIPLSRDVRHKHPQWVHDHLATISEAELQDALSQYDTREAWLGTDPLGVAVEPEPKQEDRQ